MIGRLFTDHPESVGESYLEHAAVAASFGTAMLAAGAACLVHAAVPALFPRTGSDTVRRLHDRLSRRRAEAEASGHDGQLIYEI